MITTPHVAAGVAIGVSLGNPWLVAPVALASHYFLDAIPHWQETLAPYIPTVQTYVRICLDLVLSASIILWAAHWQPDRTAAILTGALAANLPDLDTIIVPLPRLKKGLLKSHWGWHCKIQNETSSLWGIIPQLLVVVISLLVVRKA